MTQITVKQMAATKRVAMNVLPLTNKKAKLQAKIAEMTNEIADLEKQIDVQQGYVKSFAGGLTTEQLVIRNANNVFIPNPETVYFNEEKRVYVVIEHSQAGSDFDADKDAAKEEAEIPMNEEVFPENTPEEPQHEEAPIAEPAEEAAPEEETQEPSESSVEAEPEYDPFAPQN